jgi:hypothetical protein
VAKKKVRPAWGAILLNWSGLGAIALSIFDLVAPNTLLEWLGWASIPDEIHVWGHAAMWSLTHLAFWLPATIGIGLIAWANWDFIKSKFPSPALRYGAMMVIVFGLFWIPGPYTGVSNEVTSASLPPCSRTAVTPPPAFEVYSPTFNNSSISNNVIHGGPPAPIAKIHISKEVFGSHIDGNRAIPSCQ